MHNLQTLPEYQRRTAWSHDDYILYHEGSKYLMNMCGKTNRKDDERLPVDKLHRFFDDPILFQLKELVKAHKQHYLVG